MKQKFLHLTHVILSVFILQNYHCISGDLTLDIQTSASSASNTPTSVNWELKTLNRIDFTGQGKYQIETEESGAFSSYDDHTAISYKPGRAVFVFPNDTAVWMNCP